MPLSNYNLQEDLLYTENDSKIGIWATQKLPGLNDRKRAHISNMGTFTIVQPRGFGAAEIPIFESFSVYIENDLPHKITFDIPFLNFCKELDFMYYPSHQKIDQIALNYDGLLLDAYGVFWGGNEVGLLPGSKEMMAKLVSMGKIVGILSNSTQMAAKEMNKFHQSGLFQGVHYHFLVTSGEVAREIFLKETWPFDTHRKKFWVYGKKHPRFSSHESIVQGSSYQETLDIEQADFIYIGIPHIEGEDQVDPEIFREEIHTLIPTRLVMVCPNPDRFAHEGKPARYVVRQGSIAALYEEMGGNVFFIGKPHSEAFKASMHHFERKGIHCSTRILMIGDTPETDIRGANSFGMSSTLLTETGVMSDRIQKHGLENAMTALPNRDRPHFLVGRLA